MFVFKNGSWQDNWPHHRSPYLRVALIVVAVHLLLFVFAPPFHFKPYRLEAQEIMIVEDVPDFDLPKPIPEEPQPPMDLEPADDDLGEDIDPPQNVFYGDDNLPLPPRLPRIDQPGFVAFDKPPVPKHLAMPSYPELAREAGIEGVVYVKVLIDENGKVTWVAVLESNVTDSMNRSALDAARRCRFEPAKQRNKPVPVVVVIPFEFRLEKR
jgi:protein TonB